MLSTVSVTSGRILSAGEAKPNLLIGTNIFNNCPQFRMGEKETLMEMIIATRNVSRDYKLPGRETVQGMFLDKCFDNQIKNQCEKLLNGQTYMELIFKTMVQQSRS